MSSLESEILNVYKILQPLPAQTIPVVFNSPHSGTIYPENYGYASALDLLRRTEDLYIDDLYADVTKLGAPLLTCQFARSYIDVNRAEDDIDPDLLDTDWPEKFEPTIRSAAGHGLVHRLIRAGFPIYDRRLNVAEVRDRIDHYYRPYHQALKNLLDTTHYNFGQVWHIDCHSMNSLSSKVGSAFSIKEADFVLGDRDGTTCDPKFTRAIKDFLSDLGYKVSINDPYKGVELLKRYSNPQMGRHGLQIEINKSLYLNEETQEKAKNYNKLKNDLYKLCEFIADWAGAQKIAQAAD
ncbi:MAG: N-formylglutamate amidohydrolase [Micavibrio aeruginosavorus]|uniref:N-formylglutamate amidohydrolase n=1 Tax=Micavibrio aeruginosavorus TaxID=349221 RepID=A0A2W5FJV2_9BACT|nr:MAG: N-formylglutamate amidohydrolase [Micavibrio aeruginosavorus]